MGLQQRWWYASDIMKPLAPVPTHSHLHNADAYVRAVVQACTERGLRLTTTRREVLSLIAKSDHPVKAYDLLDELRERHASAAPPTVYRALDFLLDHAFIHRLDSINAFVSCQHPDEAHQVPFLICDICHGAEELCDGGAVVELVESEAERRGFQPRSQSLEVHGTCRDCQAENPC